MVVSAVRDSALQNHDRGNVRGTNTNEGKQEQICQNHSHLFSELGRWHMSELQHSEA